MYEQADVVVLSLLADAPRHGYEIARRVADMNAPRWVRIGTATVYNTLKRLARRGDVTVRRQPGRGRPDRKVYRITTRGRRRLQLGVEQLLAARTSVYSDRIVGLAFARALPPQRARAIVAALAAFDDEVCRRLEGIRREPAARDPVGQMVLGFYVDVFRAERRAAQRVLREIPRRGTWGGAGRKRR